MSSPTRLCVLVVLLTTAPGTALVTDASVSRRDLLVRGAAAAPLVFRPVRPAAAESGLSREAIEAKLSRVPVFAVTNRNDQPYLTEVDDRGRRSGFFFLDPREAIATYKDVKAVDPAASLSVVSLDSIWFRLPRSTEEALAAPQPSAGTSTDIRLFEVKPFDGEAPEANAILKRTGRPALGAKIIPLFFSPSLTLPVDGLEQRPYFFRLEDLKTSIGQDAAPVTVEVTDLTTMVEQMAATSLSPPPLLVAAAEAAALVERMGTGTSSAVGARNDPLEQLALTSPFAGGR